MRDTAASWGHVPITLVVLVAPIVLYLARLWFQWWRSSRPIDSVPVASLEGMSPRDSWINHGEEVLKQGFKTHGERPFQVLSGTTPILVLCNKYAEEISRLSSFSLSQYIIPDLFAHYPGFEGIRFSFKRENEKRLPEIIRLNLTRTLDSSIGELVDEANESTQDIFGERQEWQSSKFKVDVLHLVARLSNRIFLGKRMCRHAKWLEVTESYATDAFLASQELRAMSPLTRPVQYLWTGSCTRLRNAYRDAKLHLTEEFDRRRLEAERVLSSGIKLRGKGDSIAWITESSKGISTTELVGAQLGLVVAAIQTTAEATCVALRHLCQHPQYVEPLRQEILGLLREHGWSRASLHKMRLLDSFLKESQRFNRGCQGIVRMATQDAVLSDGLHIRTGTRVMIAGRFWDPRVLGPNVDEFDAYRFLRKRCEISPGHADAWQHTSVSPEFMGFGLGEHACPGRFFASNEMKIALSTLLLKYDWSFESGKADMQPTEKENVRFIGLESKLMYRRRHQQLDFEVKGSLERLPDGGI
ncbi:cytochrome p450 like protein [Zymoseptoria brevis]|uniref:Cytochrome p450 like protein n=1 Tax=Zymoseptoria brevis TaxID=1047168 RepID=A0A0F4G8I9_9PEZI|nr:cytochrome p450 like protein [Zymoseptoria brevis]